MRQIYKIGKTYFGSRPQTEPEILPPGPASPIVHFFHVEIVF